VSKGMAAMYRPSGDQRGEKRPCDPGSIEAWRLLGSNNQIDESALPRLPELKTILPPSGDQFGFIWGLGSAGISCWALPPCGETM